MLKDNISHGKGSCDILGKNVHNDNDAPTDTPSEGFDKTHSN